MKRILKGFVIVLCLALLLPFAFVGGGVKSYAKSNNDYIKNTILVSRDGKVSQSIIISTVIPSTYNGLEIKAFKTELASYLNKELNARKTEINNKYLMESKEEYNPENKITFGKNGYAVEGDGFVGYEIVYSSMNVFKYYNNIGSTYKEGFFYDVSTYLLDNPFNDDFMQGSVKSTQAEKYKNYYLSASEDFSFEDYVAQNYSPSFYNDFASKNSRTKSNADSVLKYSDNYYHHLWVSDGANLTTDDEMNLSLKIIHSGWWYLLGTAIPLVGMIIAIIVVKFTKKGNKKVENHDVNQ